MSKRILVVTIVIASLSTAFGGLFDSTNVQPPHSGSKALEFGLSGLFNFSHYIGNTIALKTFSRPYRATRYTLATNTGGYNLAGDGHEYEYNPTDSTIDSTNIDQTSQSSILNVSLTLQWIKYLKPYGNLALLYGIGPSLGYESRERENSRDPRLPIVSGYYRQSKDVTRTVYAGLAPVIGIEWFLHKNFSFHAEYYTLINVGWQSFKADSENENGWGGWEKSDFEMEGLYHSINSRAQAGVSFYFR